MLRRLYYFIFLLSFWIADAANVNAQVNSKSTIGNIVRIGQNVEFTINAPEPFYVGANVFVLHIGQFTADRYRQTDVDGKGALTFIIPENQYLLLKEGLSIYLTYGVFWTEEASDEEALDACNVSPDKAKYLGKLTAQMLHK